MRFLFSYVSLGVTGTTFQIFIRFGAKRTRGFDMLNGKGR